MGVETLDEFDSVVRDLLQSTGASRTTLRLDTPGKDFPVVAEACADGVRSIAPEVSISQRGAATAQRLMETGEFLIQDDCAQADPAPPAELLTVYGVQAQMLGPISQDGRVIGWLSVHYAPSTREWGENDVAALKQAVRRVERTREQHDKAVSERPTMAHPQSASEIVHHVGSGNVSATEILENHLALISDVNPRLNAIVTLCEEEARKTATKVDAAAAPGPLQGVPFVVKDAIVVDGVRTTAGSLLLEDFVPAQDASAVSRLRQAGAVFLGKTNCPEFALDPDTENRVFGRTLNPVNEAIIPGGSSGGDAAAVAAGLAVFGLGSDYGGSIRWPAQCTGVVGFRPTVGLVPLTGLLPFPPGERPALPNSAAVMSRLNTLGPLTRSVEDAWTVLEVIAGPDRLDPNTVPVPLGDPSAVAVERLACAWSDGEGTYEVRSDLVAVVKQAGASLSSHGLSVQKLHPHGLEQAADTFREYRLSESLPVHTALAQGLEHRLGDTMRDWLASVPTETTVVEYQRIADRRDAIRARVLEFMEDWPILLLPVSLAPPWPVGSLDFDARFKNMAPCWAITLLGLPSLALPWGATDEGLPISVQIVGRPFSDHEVVAIAALLEQDRTTTHHTNQ